MHLSRASQAAIAMAALGVVNVYASAATVTWSGTTSSDWSVGTNWGGAAPADDLTSDIAQFSTTFSNQPQLVANRSVNGLIIGAIGQNSTLGGAYTLSLGSGGISNANATSGRTFTIDSHVAIGAAQTWASTNSNAVTFINGNLSDGVGGPYALTLSTTQMQSGQDGVLPAWRLNGSNPGYTGQIRFSGQRMGLALMNPSAMTGGNISLGPGNTSADRQFLYLSGSTSANPFTFGIGTGAGQVQFNGSSNGSGGLLHAGNQWLRLGGSGNYSLNSSTFYVEGRVSSTTGALTLGNNADKLVLAGSFDSNIKTIKVDGTAVVDMQYGLDDTGLSGRTVRKTGSGLLVLNTAASGAQTTVNAVNAGALSVSSMNQLFNGNLDIGNNNGSGIFVFNGLSWNAFSSDRSGGEGSGANQWRLSGTGSPGFAARGTSVTINTSGTSNSTFNRNFTLGSSFNSLDGSLYANAGVNISQDIALTANRTITLAGRNQESSILWTVDSPVHELSGTISGSSILNIAGVDRQTPRNGTIRISGNNSSFTGGFRINSSSSGGAGGGGGAIAIFTDDNAFGSGSVIVGTGGSGAAGLVLFENQGATTKDFAKPFEIAMGTDASSGDSGFGSWAGDVRYTGTATITGSRTTLPVHVQSGTLRFGSGSSVTNNSTGGTQTYNKGGAGELVLDANVSYGGSAANVQWALRQGTITSTLASKWTNGTAIADVDNFTSGADGSTRTLVRQWNVTTNDHTFDLSGTNQGGVFGNNTTFNVANGVTLTFNMGGTQILNNAELLGSGTGPDGWSHRLIKSGAGTWVYNSTKSSATGSGNAAGHIRVDQGVFDVNGDMGRTSLYLNGGTILAGNLASTPFIANRLRVDPTGGKIGISTNASAEVSRSAAFDPTNNIWNLGGTGSIELASRNNLNLIWAQSAFPNIAAGETVRIERDGTGTGVVQINDTTWDVAGTLAGSGALKLGTAGTGTVTLAGGGQLRPGSSPGTLDITGNVSFASGSSLLIELDGSTPGDGTGLYDQVNVSGNIDLAGPVTLSASLLPNGIATIGTADVFYILTRSGAGTLNTSNTFAGLAEGALVSLNGGLYTARITYEANWNGSVGTSSLAGGNDVALYNVTIPEPASLSLLATGAIGLLRRRR